MILEPSDAAIQADTFARQTGELVEITREAGAHIRRKNYQEHLWM